MPLKAKRSQMKHAEAATTAPTSLDVFHDPCQLLKKQFENQSGGWKLVGCDGKAFRFHKEILSDQVSHFKDLFAHEGTTETVQKEIQTPKELNMTGPAVEAFLRYVYYQGLEGMKASFEVTSSLIRAGHYYHLPPLTKAATKVIKVHAINQKKWEWFSGEELFKLYQSVWLWEEDHPSKMELLQYVVTIFQNLCKDETKKDEILPIVGGSTAARDLILAMLRVEGNITAPKRLVQNHRSPCGFLSQDNFYANAYDDDGDDHNDDDYYE